MESFDIFNGLFQTGTNGKTISMGLGTVWINQLSDTCDVPEVRAVLTEFGVPENHKVFGIAAIGYAAAETPVKEKKFPVTYVE